MVLHPRLPSSLVLSESIQLFTLQYTQEFWPTEGSLSRSLWSISLLGDFREYATEHSTCTELPQLMLGT